MEEKVIMIEKSNSSHPINQERYSTLCNSTILLSFYILEVQKIELESSLFKIFSISER
jgi:hypothetical protein